MDFGRWVKWWNSFDGILMYVIFIIPHPEFRIEWILFVAIQTIIKSIQIRWKLCMYVFFVKNNIIKPKLVVPMETKWIWPLAALIS